MSFDSLTDGYLDSTSLAGVFDARATLARMLEFEAALARVEADLGLIPASAARAIAAACDVGCYDIDAIRRATAATSTPAIAMVQQLTAEVAARDVEAARFVHWGSTSQDVMDTALMLQTREGLALIAQRLASVADAIASLVAAHRETLMVARTLSQHALPTTFGLKLAGWLDALTSVRGHLARVAPALPVQCGGPVGTLAALATDGPRVRDALAARLGLVAALPWHTDRTIVRDVAAVLGMLAASGGKIAFDLILMMQTEVGELHETTAPGRGGSSALPHKRNPVAAIGAYAGARRAPGLLATVFASFEHMHERAAGAWHAEWMALRELFVTGAAVIEQLGVAVADLEVDAAAMRDNLARSEALVMSEAVARALADHIGRPAAQALVTAATQRATDGSQSLVEVLAGLPEVARHLGPDGLARALDPAGYLGAAQVFIDEALARHARA